MQTRPATSIIGMLIAMLIISVLFISLMPSLREIGSSDLGQSPLNHDGIQSEIDKKILEIQKIRQESTKIPNIAY